MRKLSLVLTVLVLVGLLATSAMAQSTTKILSTNFTLVNLGTEDAAGTIEYFLPDGTAWRSDVSFTLDANGGQAIYRQYDDTQLAAGRGSVMVSADQPVAAVTQILARSQNPTSSGAYSGFSQGDATFYVPLVARRGSSASGTTNSQIIVQNTSDAAVNVEIDLVNGDASIRYTKTGISLQPGASYLYDVDLEDSANVPTNWYGSAVVRVVGAGEVAVVSNFFTGDAMQTFNAFPSSAPGTTWFVPLFTSRLPNSLSTPIAVQNLSGAQIEANDVAVVCTSLDGATNFTLHNATAIGDTAAYYFNPVTDTTIPADFSGSCIVTASANVVSFVQMRFIATGEAAAYEAIPAGGTDTTVIVPLVAKRLDNGFATAITIQNLNQAADATVTLTYRPTTGSDISFNSSIPMGGSLVQNLRTTSGVTQVPAGFVGSLVVESNQPIAAFVQLTFLRDINPALPGGDNFMAHNAFTRP